MPHIINTTFNAIYLKHGSDKIILGISDPQNIMIESWGLNACSIHVGNQMCFIENYGANELWELLNEKIFYTPSKLIYGFVRLSIYGIFCLIIVEEFCLGFREISDSSKDTKELSFKDGDEIRQYIREKYWKKTTIFFKKLWNGSKRTFLPICGLVAFEYLINKIES